MKRFFYACAAILCIVLAYHFGATNAQGQSSSQIRWVGEWYATSSGLWGTDQHGWQPLTATRPAPPVPADQVLTYIGFNVVTTSGEGFVWNGSSWSSIGPIPGGATPVRQQSFGQLKARYR